MLLSSFSCASWPSVCLLWKNVYLGLLPIFGFFVFLLLSCMSSLFILDISPYQIYDLQNTFSHSVGCLFILFMVPLLCISFLIWCSPTYLSLPLLLLLLVSDLKNHCQDLCQSLQRLFSSKSFMVSGFTFKYLILFELIFVYGAMQFSCFILLHMAVQFSQHHLLKRLSFPLCIFLAPLS